MTNSIIQKYKSLGQLIAYLDFRSGHANDLSGNANNATLGATQSFSGNGLNMGTAAAYPVIADATALRLQSGGTIIFYGQLDTGIADCRKALTQQEVLELYQKYAKVGLVNQSLEGSPISTAARGGTIGQFLENTPWQFGDATGRFSVSTDTVFNKPNTKVISCSTAGLLYMPSTQASGMWEFDFYKGGALNNVIFLLMADVIGGETAVGQDGYGFYFDGEERFMYREYAAGVGANKFYSAAGYAAINTWYKCRITRTLTGIATLKIKGGAYNSWHTVVVEFGTNPSTDTTTTSSIYSVLDLDAGDKIANVIYKPLG